MPLPQGAHRLRDSAERVAWRIEQASTVTALESYRGNSSFLLDMVDNLRYYGWLTPAQLATTLRLLGEDEQTASAPLGEALADDLPNMFNGDYTINDGTEHLTYKIHTVQNGPLQGKRIVKIKQGDVFKGFAFLTITGHLKVWRRFAEDESRNERYVVWARLLVDYLRESYDGSPYGTLTTLSGETFEVQVSLRCRRCNRPLTRPSSIDRGIGPDCAGQDEQRTTAARQRETVEAPPTLAQVAESAAAEQAADNVLNVAMPTVAESVAAGLAAQQVPETEEQRENRLIAEFREQVRTMDTDEILRRMSILGTSTSNISRRRMTTLYTNLPYWRQRTTCRHCGRSNFTSERGCTNHENNYCPVQRAITNRVVREQRQRRYEQERLNLPTRTPRTPNLSQLGTVIGGEIWVQ